MEVVACAITFGTAIAQLVTVMVRLKHLWDQVTDIPERIDELLAEVEHIRLLFAEITNTIQDPAYPSLPLDFWTGPLMQCSLDRAKRAMAALETVTEELNNKLKTKRYGLQRKLVGIRGLMDKEKIQDLESRLARSVDLLWKSYDISSRRLLSETLARRVSQTIRTEMVSIAKGDHGPCYKQEVIAKPDQAANKDTSSGRGVTFPALPKAQTHQLFRWRFPTWWSTTVWDVCSAPQPGWNYGLRVYSIVPSDSAIIQSVKAGDTAAVMQLFSSKKASPFDRDQDNNSLLQLAVWSQNSTLSHKAAGYHKLPLRLIAALLQQGLCHTIHDASPKYASAFNSVSHRALFTPNPHPDHRELLELFWSYQPVADSFEEDVEPSNAPSNGSLPSFYNLTYCVKFERIRIAAFDSSGISDPDPTWISKDSRVLATHVSLSVESQESLVHSAALNIGRRRAHAGCCNSPSSKWTVADEFLRAILAVSTQQDLHRPQVIKHPWYQGKLWTGTPLMSLIGGSIFGLIMEPCLSSYRAVHCHQCGLQIDQTNPTLKAQRMSMQEALHAYVCDLQAAGVDLVAYGQKEHAFLHDDIGAARDIFGADSALMADDLIHPLFQNLPRDFVLPVRLIDLEFGAEPKQWKLVWEPELEAIARDFWETVERLPKPMPGSWVQ